jgi:hypothetical protein
MCPTTIGTILDRYPGLSIGGGGNAEVGASILSIRFFEGCSAPGGEGIAPEVKHRFVERTGDAASAASTEHANA